MIATDRDDSAVRNRSFKQYEQLGSTCADVAHHDAEFALIALQHAVAGNEAFVNRVVDLDPGSVCGCHHGLLGLLDGTLDGGDCLVEIDDHPFAAAARFSDTVAAIAKTCFARLGYESKRLGASDIQRDQKILLLFHYLFPLPFTTGFGFF